MTEEFIPVQRKMVLPDGITLIESQSGAGIATSAAGTGLKVNTSLHIPSGTLVIGAPIPESLYWNYTYPGNTYVTMDKATSDNDASLVFTQAGRAKWEFGATTEGPGTDPARIHMKVVRNPTANPADDQFLDVMIWDYVTGDTYIQNGYKFGVGTIPSELFHVAGLNISAARVISKFENYNTGAGSQSACHVFQGVGTSWATGNDFGLNAGHNYFIQDGISGGLRYFANANGVSIGGSTVEPTEALRVESTTGGFLYPRLTTVQRDAMGSKNAGLTIYNATTGELELWDGGAWVALQTGIYTDEMAQDAVGAMLDASLTYVDGTPLLQRAALTGAITAGAGSNATLLGSFTTAQLNAALSDNDIATGGGTVTGTNTGDQTSIVGITGTKAQFDTALTDGNFLFVGDPSVGDVVGPASSVDNTFALFDGTTGKLLKQASNMTQTASGGVQLGSVAYSSNFNVSKTSTGAVNYNNVFSASEIQSDVTGAANAFGSFPTTAAAVFTLNHLRHFAAVQGTFGAGSVVTNQMGFHVLSSLTGGVNNYGFRGEIPAAANRWNIYMNGTALNYLNGGLLIGSTTDTGEKLQITGTSKFTGQITSTLATGTAPFVVASTTLVTNLNADLLDGKNTGTSGNVIGLLDGNNTYSGTSIFSNAVGIGASATTVASLLVARDVTGSTTAYGVLAQGIIQTDVTGGAHYFRTFSNVVNAAFTHNTLSHFTASQGTHGDNAIVSSQIAFRTVSTLVSGTNNYMFYGELAKELGTNPGFTARTITNIELTSDVVTITTSAAHGYAVGQRVTVAATTNISLNGSGILIASAPTTTTFTYARTGTNIVSVVDTGTVTPARNWNLYMVGTALNYIGGNLLLASTTDTGEKLQVTGTSKFTGQLTSTLAIGTAPFAVTSTTLVTNLNADLLDGKNTGTSGNTVPLLDGVNTWSGNQAFSARIATGGSLLSTAQVRIGGNQTGSTFLYGVYNDGIIQSDVISGYIYNFTNAQTAAAAFTCVALYHYRAAQGTFGAGSVVTNQHGFFASNTLIGATNNFGFRGDIAAATGRWNLYMAGTAINYLASNLLLASITDSGELLQVNGTAKFTGIATVLTAAPGTNTTQIASTAFVTAAVAYALTTEITGYTETATSGEKVRLCDLAAGFTVTLPTAVGNTAKLTFKKMQSAGSIIIDGSGSQTIDGGLTATLTNQYEAITLVSNNANWMII